MDEEAAVQPIEIVKSFHARNEGQECVRVELNSWKPSTDSCLKLHTSIETPV